MRAIRSPSNGGVVITKVFAGEEMRAVGEDDVVVRRETFSGSGEGGDEKGLART